MQHVSVLIAVALLVSSFLRVPFLAEPGSVEHIAPHSLVLMTAQPRLIAVQPGRHDATDDAATGISPSNPGHHTYPKRLATIVLSFRANRLPAQVTVGWSARAPPKVSFQIAT